MGLKFSDALRLSWSNIAEHKKRSAIIILTISLLFGVIMGFNFIVSGIRETLLEVSAEPTDGKVYVTASYQEPKKDNKDIPVVGKYVSIKNPVEIQENEVAFEPILDKSADQKILGRAAEFDGEIIGYTWSYQGLGYPYQAITKTAVEEFIDDNLWAEIPEGKVPVIMPEDFELPKGADATWLREQIGDTLYRVGSAPSTETGSPTLEGFNPLNVVLSMIYGNTNSGFILVDDGSGKIPEYIKDQLAVYLSNNPGQSYELKPIEKTAVIRFNNPDKAIAFNSPNTNQLGIKDYRDFNYSVSDLFGSTLSVVSSLDSWQILITMVRILLLVIATIVAVMTFAHLIDQDAPTIALYRAMGASTGNIYLIYFLYLIELCLFAIIATIAMAFSFTAIMNLASSNALAERLMTFYNLDTLPKITLFKFENTFWTILINILVIAPLSLLFTLRRFSAKHIAKKLKED